MVGVIIGELTKLSATRLNGIDFYASCCARAFILSTPAILIGAAPTNLAGIESCAPDWPVFAADGGCIQHWRIIIIRVR